MNKLTPGSNIRWESSRMMLPEHVDALRAQQARASQIERPLLDEQTLDAIGRQLNEAVVKHCFVALSYYHSGSIRQKKCTIDKIDPIIGEIVINDAFGFSWAVPFQDIISIG